MSISLQNKKIIAWGRSKLLELYVKNEPSHQIAYVIDSKFHGTVWNGFEIKSPEDILQEDKENSVVVVFAVSSNGIQSILGDLNRKGYFLNRNVILYSDLWYEGFAVKVKNILGYEPNTEAYTFAKSFSLNSRIPVHTTILGNTLFLELLSQIIQRQGRSVVEVGAFNGGNALLASQFMLFKKSVPFYILDSFEGFPQLSSQDPSTRKSGEYVIETSYEEILDLFSIFPFAEVIKGFVPSSFSKLPENERYGLVFYDCDLYEPALATFEYFWNRMIPGGYLIVGDYVAEEGGFPGVKKATDEFFKPKDIPIHVFWENTSALVIKPTE